MLETVIDFHFDKSDAENKIVKNDTETEEDSDVSVHTTSKEGNITTRVTRFPKCRMITFIRS